MTRYLLDTNILSDLVRHPGGRVAQRISQVGAHNVCTSVIVAAELRFCAAKSGSVRLQMQVDAILGAMDVIALEPPVDVHYGDIRQALEAAGTPIGANDLLIASHARALDCVLATHNAREFERVAGLVVEDWLG